MSLFTFWSCSSSNNTVVNESKSFDLSQFPQQWTQLTKTDSGLIVFNSCYMGNSKLTFSKKNEQFELLMDGTQEDDSLLVSVASISNDTIVLVLKLRDTNYSTIIKFFDWNKNHGVISSKWGNNDISFYTTNEKLFKYSVVDQPCKECWPEEECDYIDSTANARTKISHVISTPYTETYNLNNMKLDSIHQYGIGDYYGTIYSLSDSNRVLMLDSNWSSEYGYNFSVFEFEKKGKNLRKAYINRMTSFSNQTGNEFEYHLTEELLTVNDSITILEKATKVTDNYLKISDRKGYSELDTVTTSDTIATKYLNELMRNWSIELSN